MKQTEEQEESEIGYYPPNNTLYINNLNESIPIEDIKHVLQQVFSQFGNVLDVVSKKNFRMKGQAFVIFEELQSAEQALEALQAKVLFDKKMRVNYAFSKSDIISKKDGSFVTKDQRPVREVKKKINKQKKREESQLNNSLQLQVQNDNGGFSLPNKILFVEKLPSYIDQDILNEIFQTYAGFIEVRLITSRGVAFIEFQEDYNAAVAVNELNNKPITSEFTLHISFAKK